MNVGLREFLTRNIGWKLGGLALALALWFHLATEKVYDKSYPVEIEITGLPDSLRVDKIEPPTEDVIVTGTGKQLIKLSFSNKLRLRADLSNARKPGIFEHRFTIADLVPIDPSQYKRITLMGDGLTSIYIVAGKNQ